MVVAHSDPVSYSESWLGKMPQPMLLADESSPNKRDLKYQLALIEGNVLFHLHGSNQASF